VFGYTGGGTPDELADPAPVFPPREVVVPQDATSPLMAGPDTISSGGLTVIGPFRVNWDDPEIDSGTGSGVVLDTIPDSAMVVRAWAIPRTVWTYTGGSGDPILLILGLNTGTDGPLLFYNAQIDSLFASAYDVGRLGAEPYSDTASYLAVAEAASEANGPTTLRAFVQSSAALTAGSVDIYAIIAPG
jgi:hypothetical protein